MPFEDARRMLTLDAISSAARKALPRPAFRALRIVGSVVLAPLRFSILQGHALSALRQKAVDRHGAPLPWYSYPAIAFLRNRRFEGRKVLEFGAGNSTLWWRARASHVVSLDADAAWLRYVKENEHASGSGEVHLVHKDLHDIPSSAVARKFDVIVIDGLTRQHAAVLAPDMLEPEGAIILDNSDLEWGNAPGEYFIIELMNRLGFFRVDFFGFGPGNVREQCTSVFFRDGCFLFRSADPPRVEP